MSVEGQEGQFEYLLFDFMSFSSEPLAEMHSLPITCILIVYSSHSKCICDVSVIRCYLSIAELFCIQDWYDQHRRKVKMVKCVGNKTIRIWWWSWRYVYHFRPRITLKNQHRMYIMMAKVDIMCRKWRIIHTTVQQYTYCRDVYNTCDSAWAV